LPYPLNIGPRLMDFLQRTEDVFFNQPLLMLEDLRHRDQETRFHALGKTLDGRALHITFTLTADGTLIRVISARDMHRKERSVHDQAR
jgi:uncharacterized DUF497 family protein